MDIIFKGWTTFEIAWLTIFTLIQVALFFIWDDTLLGFISSISGMLCVVLVAKGKISNYYFGIIQCATYAYISYTYGLYGEAMLNGLFYLPIQFIGIYMWNNHKTDESIRGEDIVAKRLTKKGWIILLVISVSASVIYAELLYLIGSQQVRIDSVAVVLSIIAQILMLQRYAEQWVMWIVVNGLTIVLWLVTLLASGGNDWSMLVMWTAFLINSIYGYINWLRISKQHTEEYYVQA